MLRKTPVLNFLNGLPKNPEKWFARTRLSSRDDALFSWLGVALLLLIWCGFTYLGLVKQVFLPKPTGIVDGLLDFYHRNWLFPAIWRSFRRVTISLLLVLSIGVPVGIA